MENSKKTNANIHDGRSPTTPLKKLIIAVALISGLVGCFVVWKRMSYYGESIAHGSLLGVAFAILIGVSINLGVVFTCLLF